MAKRKSVGQLKGVKSVFPGRGGKSANREFFPLVVSMASVFRYFVSAVKSDTVNRIGSSEERAKLGRSGRLAEDENIAGFIAVLIIKSIKYDPTKRNGKNS